MRRVTVVLAGLVVGLRCHDAGALPPSTAGEVVLGRDHLGKPWPLPAGRYVVHYLLTDQYSSVGSTTFTVR